MINHQATKSVKRTIKSKGIVSLEMPYFEIEYVEYDNIISIVLNCRNTEKFEITYLAFSRIMDKFRTAIKNIRCNKALLQ